MPSFDLSKPIIFCLAKIVVLFLLNFTQPTLFLLNRLSKTSSAFNYKAPIPLVMNVISHRPVPSTELANILITLNRPSQTHTVSPCTRIGHVLLRAINLEESEKFYIRNLGFGVSMRMQDAVFVAAGGYHHHVGFHVWEILKGKSPPKSAAGLRYFTIQVPSYESFLKIRETFHEEDTEIKVDDRIISLSDPSGNGIIITSNYGGISEEAIELEVFFQMGNKR